jgi:hypothetical protein
MTGRTVLFLREELRSLFFRAAVAIQDFSPIFFFLLFLHSQNFCFCFFRKNRISLVHIFGVSSGTRPLPIFTFYFFSFFSFSFSSFSFSSFSFSSFSFSSFFVATT